PASQLIKAASIFVDNPDSNVAVHGGEHMASWYERGFVGSAALADYRRVVGTIYGRKLASLGFNPGAGAHASDTPDVQKLRQEVVYLLADQAHDPATRKTLNAAATAYLAGNTKALDQSFYDEAMRVHVEDGNLATTKDLYARMVDAKDELFRSAALEAVASSRRPEDARWVISQFKDKRLRSTDKIGLMKGLMGNEETRDLAFDWLKVNYDDFAKGAGIFASSWIPSLPSDYCSVEKSHEVDQLLRPKVVEAGRGELPFNRMLESISTCGKLKAAKSQEIATALKQAASAAHSS
ncbi:MAG TPA: ERAP1-like C-terminal domain-containing protein, partial [Povalibacter sp.]|nr:ERAP1-like C-terminal domain-containing protein [Povalibacter sp.]